MNYDIDFFLNRAENTPDELWCVGTMGDGIKHCFVGQCESWMEFSALSKICGDLANAADVNDGLNLLYPQETPRFRVIAYLMDKKAEQAVAEAEAIIQNPVEVLEV